MDGIASAGGVALVLRDAGGGVRAGTASRLAGVRLGAGVPVVARRPVRLRRVRAHARASCRTSRRRGTGPAPCTSPGSRPSRCPTGRCRSACRRCRRCTRSRSPSPGSSRRPSSCCTSRPTWHWSGAVQTTGFAPVQLPAWQVSVCVQALPSLHAVPFALAGFEHTPVARVARPREWHWSERRARHRVRADAGPAWHVSRLRAGVAVAARRPVRLGGIRAHAGAGLHVPATWHWSERRAGHRVGAACSVPA